MVFAVLWCPGGPAGDLSAFGDEFEKEIAALLGVKRLYIRARFDRSRDIEDVLLLNYAGWNRSTFILHSGFTMEIDLLTSTDKRLKKCSRSWRRNLKTAQKNKLNARKAIESDIDNIYHLFGEMQKRKNLVEIVSRKRLEWLLTERSEHIISLCVEDEQQTLLAFECAFILGERAVSFIAASSPEARSQRAGYLAFWTIMEECRNSGAYVFDLGGIDPISNPGVYTFKRQSGGKPVESLGEWDSATSSWICRAANEAIMIRDLRNAGNSRIIKAGSKISRALHSDLND